MELIKINRQFGENTKHYIYRVLKMNIMTLNIKPGTGISEADIREFLKVSRTPIRESIVRLSEERLMDVYPQKGSFVSLIDLKIVEEAYFMRKILEKEVLKLATKNFSEAAIKELEKKGYKIAMHGFNHVYDTKTRGNINCGFKSEFAGHSFIKQYEKIKKGKEILEFHNVYTDVFFAPSHSYDDNTLRALSKCGFKYISDGYSKKIIRLQ